jgi:hypothetical protein
MEHDSGLIRAYLESNGITGLPREQRLRATVKRTAEIPWGEGRTIEEVLDTKKAGTCTGKHLVLAACLDELGIRYRQVVCTFRWGDQAIEYPDSLKAHLAEGEWEHGHNFIQIEVNGGFADVDITWNSRLEPYGFRTFPRDWDGRAPHIGVDRIIKRWDGTPTLDLKKRLIDSLDAKTRKRREEFLDGFIRWVKTINA